MAPVSLDSADAAARRRERDVHRHRHVGLLVDDRGEGVARVGRGRARRRADPHREPHVGPPPAGDPVPGARCGAGAPLVGADRLPVHAAGVLPLRLHPRLPHPRRAGDDCTRSPGSFLYGVFAAKVLIVRSRRYPHWVPPVVGGTLATLLVALWLTSSLWYFTNVRFGF